MKVACMLYSYASRIPKLYNELGKQRIKGYGDVLYMDKSRVLYEAS
jgi:hypothetical protein